ncbi:predicted protein [Aspergillus udagawae]|nr:predicted protein [Aspergillus udagawae]
MDRGYNPAVDPRIHLEYVEDGKRSGRPKEITEAIEEGILDSIRKDRNGREKSSEILAYEAAQDKRLAEQEIFLLNQKLEPIRKAEWELNTSMARLKLRNGRAPGRAPTWKWNKKNGLLSRDSKGGVDWYRYYKEVLIPKLIPFAQECAIERPNTIVLEDGAPAHRHRFQQTMYDIKGVQKIMDWPGNSPDLNAIEPAWPWLKRRTTSRGAPRDKKTGKEYYYPAKFTSGKIVLHHTSVQDHKSIEAIYSLGIQLIVLDRPDHWLEPDASFADRLTRALKALRVDGVVTRNDMLVTAVARVVEISNGTQQHLRRPRIRPSDLQEKLHPSDGNKPLRLQYPLVVKPCEGNRSHCVSKHEGTVLVASDVLIKPYIDGSEVAVNFVLWNGEILFCEVSDDFPSNADSPGATSSDTFQETAFVHPSRLAPSEQNLLRKALLDRILHIHEICGGERHTGPAVQRDEGRAATAKAKCIPLKVNPHPPGHYGLTSLTWTYGLDYFALHVPHALGDEARVRALSEPFMCGPQYDGVIMLVIPERGGILTSGDPAGKFREEHPGIMDNILLRREPFAKGDFVPSPDAPTMPFLSVLVPCLKNGRGGVLHSMAII